MTLFIDFETHSQADLKKIGAWNYSLHPTTDVFCMAYTWDDEKDIQLWTPGEARPYAEGNEQLEAHNAFFERSIWENIMVPRYGWPKLRPDQWYCSAAKCAARGLPRSLEMAAKVVKLPLQKDMSGSRLMLKMTKAKEWEKDDLEKLYEYCRTDVAVERMLSQRLGDLSPQERQIWLLDQEINHRGVALDIPACQNALAIVNAYSSHLTAQIPILTGGAVESVTQRDRTLKWLASKGVSSEKLAKRDVTTLLAMDLEPDVRKVLEIRQQVAKTSTAKFQGMLDRVAPDGRIRDNFRYYGASTGRWAAQGVQLQNLAKPSIKDVDFCIKLMEKKDWKILDVFYDSVMGAVSSCIRGMLVAGEGKKLVAADYNAIECRIAFWIADEKRGLQMFRDGVDTYVDMAMDIYRKKTAKEISKDQRFLGKTTILGCSYGMGAERFLGTCHEWGVKLADRKPKETDIEFLRREEEMALTAVTAYRMKFPAVKQCWYDIERAAIVAMQNKGKTLNFRKLKWVYEKQALWCILPSGRRMAYNQPSISYEGGSLKLSYMSINAKTKKWEKETIWGGTLFENTCQAISRDIMAFHMLQLSRGIVMTVHDEVVWEIDQGMDFKPETYLEKPPEWAKDLPLKVETWEGKRYKK
jgi:DNA polymerase